MPEVSIDVEVYCARCGAGLCNQTNSTFTKQRRQPCFQVEPCARCFNQNSNENYNMGYEDGYQKAKAESE